MFKMSRVVVWWSNKDSTSIHNFLIFLNLFLIINILHNVWIVENIFINNYTLNEYTHHCITYCVTTHPDGGQAQPKHVGATNCEKTYIYI
jgi:hypothetical protein